MAACYITELIGSVHFQTTLSATKNKENNLQTQDVFFNKRNSDTRESRASGTCL